MSVMVGVALRLRTVHDITEIPINI